MKKIIAMLLALVMIFALCACGSSSSTTAATTATAAPAADNTPAAADDSPAGEDGPAATNRTIGINDLVQGAYALDVLVNSCRTVTDICGDKLQVANDEGNVEKIVSDLENFIASGVDGILWFGLLPTNFAVGPQKCEDAGVPIAFYDKLPLEGEQQDAIQQLSMYAGGVGNSDYLGGRNMGEYAVSLGCKKAVIAGAEVGDTTHDPRIQGFTEVFEAAGGEILSVFRGAAGTDATAAVDNMINANPDCDCVFGSGGDYALAAISVCNTYGLTDIKVLGVDISPDLLPYLRDGSLAAGCGAHWVAGMFTAAMLENYLDGCPITDEDGVVAMIRNTPLIVIPAEMADLYEEFWINEFPYEEDEIKALLYRYNPDVTLQDFEDAISGYSVESRLLAKYEAGKVTAEQLAAVGINVG